MILHSSDKLNFDCRIIDKPQEIEIATSSCDDTRVALDYWRQCAGERLAPGWRDINLLDFPAAIIPRILVVDVAYEPMDFIYRFFGTWHAACHKRDMSGLSIDAYDNDAYRKELYSEYSVVVERREPVLYNLEMYLNNILYNCEILRLPLSSDGAQIDGILVVETPIPQSLGC